MNNDSTPEWTPLALREMAFGFQKSRAFLTSFELSLFTLIGEAEKPSDEIAHVIRANPRATNRLLNTMVGLGFLVKNNESFSNTDFAKRYLVKSSPDYLGGMAHAETLWRTWSTLTAAVIAGTSVVERRYHHDDNDPLRGFIAAMHDRGRLTAAQIASQIDWKGVDRVLDLGGGSGVYAMAFVRTSKDVSAVVFDLPVVIPITEEYIRNEGLSNRIDTIAGDYLHDSIGSGYDVIFLSAIIHSNAKSENRNLIKNCAYSINTGGRIIVQDFIMNDDRVTPPFGALFALNMLVATNAGDTYTESEITEWFHAAGIKNVSRNETGLGTTQLIGKK